MPHTNSARRPFRAPDPSGTRDKGQRKAKRGTEAIFDETARTEYLTGFGKRKKARTEAAKVRAARREKDEKRELKKQLRESRKSQIENNVREQAEYYGNDAFATAEPSGSGSEASGAEDSEGQNKEYEDTDGGRRTTVTVEDFNIDHDELGDAQPPHPSQRSKSRQSKLSSSASRRNDGKAKAVQSTPAWMTAVKKKRIPYESKATRTLERAKKQKRRAAKKEKR